MAKQRVAFKAVKRFPKPDDIATDIISGLRPDAEKIRRRVMTYYKRVTANWSADTRPTFTSRVSFTIFNIGIRVYVKEKKRDRPIWKWLDITGTKAHIIRPKPGNKKGLLFFEWGGPGSYQAKTGAEPARYGGPGRVNNGQLTAAKRVRHPGFKPRKFSEKITKDTNKAIQNLWRKGGRRGLQKSKGKR